MKVVINRQFGGFGLSLKGIRALATKEGWEPFFYKMCIAKDGSGVCEQFVSVTDDDKGTMIMAFQANMHGCTAQEEKDGMRWSESDLDRSDPNLVAVVEELGDEANGRFSTLKVVEVPDDVKWHIEEYDGMEHVAEDHRTW